MIWVAFAFGLVIGCCAGILTVGLCEMASDGRRDRYELPLPPRVKR